MGERHTFTEIQLDPLFTLTHKCSVDTKMQDNGFKLLTQWYRVPATLARIYPVTPDIFWRSCGIWGTYLHICWECPRLWLYWQDNKVQIKVILDIKINYSPLAFLFQVPSNHPTLSVFTVNRFRPTSVFLILVIVLTVFFNLFKGWFGRLSCV